MVKLLAPVGTLEKGISLFENMPKGSIEAIYFSPKRSDKESISWGRRRAQHALNLDDITELISRAKEHQVSEFHLAMNNNLVDADLPLFMADLGKYVDLGITHVILCEPGAIRKVRTEFPDIKIDLSIMAYVTSSQDAEFYRDLGVSSIALPHMLPKEVAQIRNAGVNVNLFVLGYYNPERRNCCYNSEYMGGPSWNRDGACMRACVLDWQASLGGKTYEHLTRDAGPYCILPKLEDYISVLGENDYLKIQGREWPAEIVNRLVDVTNRLRNGENVPLDEITDVDKARIAAMKSLTREIHASPLPANEVASLDLPEQKTTRDYELTVSTGELDTLLHLDLTDFDIVYFGRFDKCSRRKEILAEDIAKAAEFVHSQHKKIYLTLPATLRDDDYTSLESLATGLEQADGIEIHNYGILNYLSKRGYAGEIVGGAWLNVYNQATSQALKKRGVKRILLPYEASSRLIASVSPIIDIETPVHGHLPLTIANSCIREQTNNELECDACTSPLDAEFHGKWVRHYGKVTLTGSHFCLYEQLGNLTASGLRLFRIEGQSVDPESLSVLGKVYRRKLNNPESNELERLRQLSQHGFCNGFLFNVAGHKYIRGDRNG